MRRALIVCVLALTACGGNDENPTVNDTPTTLGPEAFGVPADADVEAITTPEGGTVYRAGDTIYGPCDLIQPNEDDLAGWLNLPDLGNGGHVCIDT